MCRKIYFFSIFFYFFKFFILELIISSHFESFCRGGGRFYVLSAPSFSSLIDESEFFGESEYFSVLTVEFYKIKTLKRFYGIIVK